MGAYKCLWVLSLNIENIAYIAIQEPQKIWKLQKTSKITHVLGRVQNLEWLNVKWPIFRKFKITNIKIAKDELFDYFIYVFVLIIFLNFLKLLQHLKYLTIFTNYKIF